MPKIIENLREALLLEAKRQIAERGYKATTIRSVAGECDVAIGTVYNYFSSKDMLIASFMLEDWIAVIDSLKTESAEDSRSYLFSVYSALRAFAAKHSALFADKEAAKVYNSVFYERHKQLRAQLAELLLPICSSANDPSFTAEFISESMLAWTMAGRDFESIYEIIKKIII